MRKPTVESDSSDRDASDEVTPVVRDAFEIPHRTANLQDDIAFENTSTGGDARQGLPSDTAIGHGDQPNMGTLSESSSPLSATHFFEAEGSVLGRTS